MAKKFVRGITDVKTINNQDFDTNNVNDLLSDGEHNYIHRKKKDKSEEYHNLTNNLKTLSSDNTDLLTVTNNNNTTNSAVLSPLHDKLKEQVIESTRNTIDIDYGANNTTETTKVDTNPQHVIEHENLKGGNNITVTHKSGSNDSTVSWSDDAMQNFAGALSDINVLKDSKENRLQSLADTIYIISAPEIQNETIIDVNPEKVAFLDNIQSGENVKVAKSGNVVTISSTITPQKITINNDFEAIVYTLANYNYITIISRGSIQSSTIDSRNEFYKYLQTLHFSEDANTIMNGLIEITKLESTYTITSHATTINQQLFIGWTE